MVAGQIYQLIAPVKGAILQNQRDVIFTGRQSGSFFFVIRNQKKPGQTAVYLGTGQTVGMGMVPVSPGPVANLELVNIGFTFGYYQ